MIESCSTVAAITEASESLFTRHLLLDNNMQTIEFYNVATCLFNVQMCYIVSTKLYHLICSRKELR